MGLFAKIKDILFEEEVVEVPEFDKDNKKNKKDEKERPKEELHLPELNENFEKKEKAEEVKELDLFKSEPTFPFPLEIEKDLPEIKSRSSRNTNVLDYAKKNKKDVDSNIRKIFEEEKSKPTAPFRPSPVISPVYGILDKNYKKEDILPKKVTKCDEELNFDTVRQKAFGTLEEDIELSIEKSRTEFYSTNENNKTIDELLLDTLSIELNENELPKEKNDSSEPSAMDILDEIESGLDEIKEKKQEIENKTLETDLFNLIDEMYEKEEEFE